MTRQILYVEDHPNNRLLVNRIVEAEGFIFLPAVDGAAGWATAVAQKPDLIFMDLHLPGQMSGFELTHRLKAHPQLAHIPIVALTALGSSEAETAAFAAGCDAFLQKPADIRQIRDVIHRFLDSQPLLVDTPTTGAVAYI